MNLGQQWVAILSLEINGLLIEVSRAIAKLHRARLTTFNMGCEKKKKSYEDVALTSGPVLGF